MTICEYPALSIYVHRWKSALDQNSRVVVRSWFVRTHAWLERFPLPLIQRGMRIAVGSVFFNSGLIEISSREFAIKRFEDEYKVPLLDPTLAAAGGILGADIPGVSFPRAGDPSTRLPRCVRAGIPTPCQPLCAQFFLTTRSVVERERHAKSIVVMVRRGWHRCAHCRSYPTRPRSPTAASNDAHFAIPRTRKC